MSVAAAAIENAASLARELADLPASPRGGGAAPAAAASSEEDSLQRCLVYCRLRPSKKQDYEDGAYKLISMTPKSVILKDERNYDVDGTFDEDSRQEDIFERVARPNIEHALKGYRSALLAYGQTGTGKSFTMCCTKPGIEGIIPRAAKFIFQQAAATPSRRFEITAQFVQIYRDQLGDLMLEGGRDKVDIRFEKDDGVTLPGCSGHPLASPEEFMAFYNEGDKRRVVMATAMNPESSRGHSALVVNLASFPCDATDCGASTRGKITFIDLAGYERFSKTGISNSDPIRKDEAKTINASLLSLGHVVTSLSNGDKHIPWRNAKLTRLLQDSIGGRSRTSIILTVGPSSEHLHESTNSLQFGQRAMAVKVQSKISAHVDYEKLAHKLQALLDEKDEKISSLEIQLAAQEAERSELKERHTRDEDTMRAAHREQLDGLRASGASAERILEVTSLFEIELENMQEQQREEVAYQQESANKEVKALLDEQAKMTRRMEDEARAREESRLRTLEEKLAQARGADSTADLERCLKQLAERDGVLVSRAGERARLQALCATLIQQVRQMGGTPTHCGEFEESFMDVVQVEELRAMLVIQVEGLQAQASDLRIQLAAVQAVATERTNEVQELREAVDKANAAAAATAAVSTSASTTAAAPALASATDTAATEGADDGTATTANTTTTATTAAGAATSRKERQLVDKTEVDTVRTLLQVDIDMLTCKVRMLEAQLAQAGLAPAPSQSAFGGGGGGGGAPAFHINLAGLDGGGMMAQNDSFAGASSDGALTGRRKRGNTVKLDNVTPRGGGGGGAGAGSGSNNSSTGSIDGSKAAVELRAKLLAVQGANVALNDHVRYLESLVSDLGGACSPAPPQEMLVTAQQVVDTAADIARAKNDEMDRLMALLEAREAVINDQAMQMDALQQECRRVVGSAGAGDGNGDGPSLSAAAAGLATPAQQSSSNAKQFVELIRAARSAQRAAEEKLYVLQQRQAAVRLSALLEEAPSPLSASSVSAAQTQQQQHAPAHHHPSSGLSSPSNVHADAASVDSLMSPKYAPRDTQELATALRANDDRLLELETRAIELDTQNGALKRMVAALERQLEDASIAPVCGLAKADRDVIDADRAKDRDAAQAAAAELRAQLKAQAEEKARVESMLADMSKQRARDASVYSTMEEQLQAQKAQIAAKVEEDRRASQSAMSELQRVAEQHASEARRLQAALDERERRDREQADEAERVRVQLESAKQLHAERDAEAARLREQLQARDRDATDKNDEAARLKAQLQENTRAMMDDQARKAIAAAEAEAAKPQGFFDKLRNWKI